MKIGILLVFVVPTMVFADQHRKLIEPLTEEDTTVLEKQRQVIKELLTTESRKGYTTAAGKLEFLQNLIDRNVFKKDQIYEFHCMGVVLGDAIAEKLEMKWGVITDETGRNVGLLKHGHNVGVLPIIMISEKIERGENVTVSELVKGVEKFVAENSP